MSNLQPVPYSCTTCRARGSPHGVLVWPDPDGNYPQIDCRYHKPAIPMERSPFYDSAGNRITKKENK